MTGSTPFPPPAPSPQPAQFPSTRWSIIAAGGRGSKTALEHLARDYWGPIARAIDRRTFRGESDDLAQEFFLWLQESDFLTTADPNRGRFRAFLQTALRRFVIDRHRHATAKKRGGGAKEELDAADAVTADLQEPAERLDQEWRRQLIATALNDIRQQLDREGKALYYQLFEAFYVGNDGDTSYETLAQQHNIQTSDVSNWLTLAKKRYRTALRARITETVRDPQSLREELAWFFGEEVPDAK